MVQLFGIGLDAVEQAVQAHSHTSNNTVLTLVMSNLLEQKKWQGVLVTAGVGLGLLALYFVINKSSSSKKNKATQGFGCMGFSAFYSSSKTTTPERAREVIHRALKAGVTLFNSATFYGDLNEKGFGANLRLLKECFKGVDRSKYQLMVKIGMDTR
jgi:hypothetical protein